MKTKKRTVTMALVAALIALLIGGGTMAYFQDTDSADTNVFTVGDVDIELYEPSWVQPEYVSPGENYAKDPYVANEGTNPAWVRINVTVSDWAALSAAAANHGITDLSTIFNGHDETLWTLAGAPTVDAAADTVTYSYYYNTAIAKNTSTSYLFTSVTIPKVFTTTEMESLGEDFTIDISADAIQADGFDTPQEAFDHFE